MVAVAKEAQVSRQLVYDHFPDLPTLFKAAFAEEARQYAAGFGRCFRPWLERRRIDGETAI